MTQIIAALTHQHTLLVSDRLLTNIEGPNRGKKVAEQECKLVSLCHTSAIGYTGLACLGGMPTHEWIATTLAKTACTHAAQATAVLLQSANAALPNLPSPLRRQAFLLAGWALFQPDNAIRPHVCLVSNFHTEDVVPMADSEPNFRLRLRALGADEDIFVFAIGQPLPQSRKANLVRNLRRLLSRELGPKDALRLLVQEVFFTNSRCGTVGDKVLACCIPRTNAERFFTTGQSRLSGLLPLQDRATFSYFDPHYNEHTQYGPTVVCGSHAFADLRYTKEKNGPHQSAQLRVLYAPKKET